MAAGVPTTGIGGFFYILLAIAIGLSKLLTKIRALLHRGIQSYKPYRLMRFPTVAVILSIVLILYMNASGFRFTVPGSQEIALPTSSWITLGLIGVIVVSFFMFILLMFHIRANMDALMHKRTPIVKILIVISVASVAIGALFVLNASLVTDS